MLVIGGRKIFYQDNMYKSLIQIFGINFKLIKLISKHTGIPYNLKFKQIDNYGNFQYKNKIYFFFKMIEYNLESFLKRYINNQINLLIDINCYKGFRHKLGFPVRGQRTHTNAKTIEYVKNKKKVPTRYKKKIK